MARRSARSRCVRSRAPFARHVSRLQRAPLTRSPCRMQRVCSVETVQLATAASGRAGADIFTGVTAAEGAFSPRVFGGQLCAQALVAAARTLPPANGGGARRCHSMHSYFLSAGDVSEPFVFTVERLRDGGSFSQRQVVARQRGEAVFTMTASYQSEATWNTPRALRYQLAAPEGVPPPESLPTQQQTWEGMLADSRLDESARGSVRRRYEALPPFPLDIRFVKPIQRLAEMEPREPTQFAWVRMPESFMGDGREELHEAVVAYASDWGLLETCCLPHGMNLSQRRIRLASLDHTIYFHHPVSPGEWLLYHMQGTSSSGERGLAQGFIYSRDGQLKVSVFQEGLMRVVERNSAPRSKL